jgi:hypothetical protein
VNPLEWEIDQLNIVLKNKLNVVGGELHVSVINDLSVVADDVPYVIGAARDVNVPGTLDGAPDFFAAFKTVSLAIQFCNPDVQFVGDHFSNLWYDPTLSVLFSPSSGGPSGTPENEAKRKSENLTKIIGGIAAAVIVVAVIAAILIAYNTSSAFKLWVRPYLAREQKIAPQPIQADPPHNEVPSKPEGWARANKPSQS